MNVDFEAKTATITMKAGKTLTKEDAEKAFGATRYKISTFETAGGA